jgi:hypothetical protein
MNLSLGTRYQNAAAALYSRSTDAAFDALPTEFAAAADAGPALTGEAAANFMLAGNATFTLESRKTGMRYTFKVRRSETGDVHFVSLLTGSDNESDYSYVGIIGTNGFRLTKKSRMSMDSVPVKAFSYTYGFVARGESAPGVEIHHAGRCGRCGRKLTVPSSIETGLGPECARKGMAA